MNRWILRGLATAGCAAGWWLLTAAPAYADAPTTPTTQHADSGTLLGIRLNLDSDNHPALRARANAIARPTGTRATGAHTTGAHTTGAHTPSTHTTGTYTTGIRTTGAHTTGAHTASTRTTGMHTIGTRTIGTRTTVHTRRTPAATADHRAAAGAAATMLRNRTHPNTTATTWAQASASGKRTTATATRKHTDPNSTTATTQVWATVTGDHATTAATREDAHMNDTTTTRVRGAITGDRTHTTGRAATARPNADRPATTHPAATVTACLSILAPEDCGSTGTSNASPVATAARRPVADAKTAVTHNQDGLNACVNAAVLDNATTCRTAPADRTTTRLGTTTGTGSGTTTAETESMVATDAAVTVDDGLHVCLNAAILGNNTTCDTARPDTTTETGSATTTTTEPIVATDAAVTVDDGLHVCLNAAILGNTTCGTESAIPTHTAGNELDLCLTATLAGGCGTEPGDQSVAAVVVDAQEALDPVALNACLTIGVLSDAETCGRDTTTPNTAPSGSDTPGAGVDLCLTIGSTNCGSPAEADGFDPTTNPGTGPGTTPGTATNAGTETETGTGAGTGTGTGMASIDGRNDGTRRDVAAVFGNPLTGRTTELPRTGLPLTGPALAGTALALITAGFLLIAATRRRRRRIA